MAASETTLPPIPRQGVTSRLESAIKGAGEVIAKLGTAYDPLIEFHEKKSAALDQANEEAWVVGDHSLPHFDESWKHTWKARRLKAAKQQCVYVEDGVSHPCWSPEILAENLVLKAGKLLRG